MATPDKRLRNQRLEIRTTAEERSLLQRAAKAAGTDLTTFAISHLSDAARRVLADREAFELSPAASADWERINEQPARVLLGLKRLLERPSPFTE